MSVWRSEAALNNEGETLNINDEGETLIIWVKKHFWVSLKCLGVVEDLDVDPPWRQPMGKS